LTSVWATDITAVAIGEVPVWGWVPGFGLGNWGLVE
jgi:hypothetical protein